MESVFLCAVILGIVLELGAGQEWPLKALPRGVEAGKIRCGATALSCSVPETSQLHPGSSLTPSSGFCLERERTKPRVRLETLGSACTRT